MRLINFVRAKSPRAPLKNYRRLSGCFYIFALLLIMVRPAAAQENTLFLEAFPFLKKTAKILSSDVADLSTTDFALSSIKKVNARWRVDDVKSLAGQLRKNTYELTELTATEVAEQIKNDVARLNWSVQFQCAGLACGTSYAWATQVFNDKLLDGVDALQYYWVWKTPAGWARIYVVERGNKRVYLHSQLVVESSAAVNSSLESSSLKQWQQQGFAEWEFTNIDTLSHAQITPLLQWLKDLGGVGFAVVGHSDVRGDIEVLKAGSLKNANKVADKLKTLQPELNIQTYGLGPLAPRIGKGARIEIVPILL